MKQESVEQGHAKSSMQRWASSQAADMAAAGIVCIGCILFRIILGHKDRVHCKHVRRTIDAKESCEDRIEANKEIQFFDNSAGGFGHSPQGFVDWRPICPGVHKSCQEYVSSEIEEHIVPIGTIYCVNETSCKVCHKPGERPDICGLCRGVEKAE